jgi:glucosylceramidase
MIKAIKAAAAVPDIHIVSTTWSPPPWMKTNNDYTGYSRVKPEYFQTYADYHYK